MLFQQRIPCFKQRIQLLRRATITTTLQRMMELDEEYKMEMSDYFLKILKNLNCSVFFVQIQKESHQYDDSQMENKKYDKTSYFRKCLKMLKELFLHIISVMYFTTLLSTFFDFRILHAMKVLCPNIAM